VVERKLIGGACPNVACLPSKNVIHTAKIASLLFRRHEFGIQAENVSIHMAGVYLRKREMVEDLIKMHLDQYQSSGAELILGEGQFTESHTIHVALPDGGERTLTGERVFINTGSHATVPDIPGLKESKPLTHIEALDLERLPEHLVVLGGGYVGLELSQALRRLGSRVTVIEHASQLATREDPDVAEAILQLFRDEGIDVLLNTETLNVEGHSGKSVRLSVQSKDGKRTLEGTDILVALGRTPNTRGIGLEAAGIEITDAGHVRVNDRLEATQPNVWALGECAGSPYFTHVSEDDFDIVHTNLNGGNRTTRGRLIPYGVFIDPPLGRVGLTETEARAAKIDYRAASLPMAAVLRTRTLSETRGFLKTIVDAHSDRILGFTAFGPDAAEIMGTVQVAMLAGQPYTILSEAIFAHPTMNEGVKSLFAAVPAKPSAREEKKPRIARART
jgi:pyruvate/2-oxoglutarate dehydrogenase complex dihydrolipoamide dehydrogenase (E3) component